MKKDKYTEFEKLIKGKVDEHSYPYQESDWLDFEKKLPRSHHPFILSPKNLIRFFAAISFATLIYFAIDNFFLQKDNDSAFVQQNELLIKQQAPKQNESETSQKKTSDNNITVSTNPFPITNSTSEADNNFNTSQTKFPNQEPENSISKTTEQKPSTNKELAPLKNTNVLFNDYISADVNEGCAPLLIKFSPIIVSDTISYLWNFGDSKTSTLPIASHIYSKPGIYNVTLTYKFKISQQTKKIQYSKRIEVKESPYAQFDFTKNNDDNVYTFTCRSGNTTECLWDFGDNTISNEKVANHAFKQSKAYNIRLIVVNSNGCSDTLNTNINVKLNELLLLPTAFTPDGDGINDFFGPENYFENTDKYKMTILDKSGNILFETKDPQNKWDGKNRKTSLICEQGVYIWLITYIDKQNNLQEQKGFVTLIK